MVLNKEFSNEANIFSVGFVSCLLPCILKSYIVSCSSFAKAMKSATFRPFNHKKGGLMVILLQFITLLTKVREEVEEEVAIALFYFMLSCNVIQVGSEYFIYCMRVVFFSAWMHFHSYILQSTFCLWFHSSNGKQVKKL